MGSPCGLNAKDGWITSEIISTGPIGSQPLRLAETLMLGAISARIEASNLRVPFDYYRMIAGSRHGGSSAPTCAKGIPNDRKVRSFMLE